MTSWNRHHWIAMFIFLQRHLHRALPTLNLFNLVRQSVKLLYIGDHDPHSREQSSFTFYFAFITDGIRLSHRKGIGLFPSVINVKRKLFLWVWIMFIFPHFLDRTSSDYPSNLCFYIWSQPTLYSRISTLFYLDTGMTAYQTLEWVMFIFNYSSL